MLSLLFAASAYASDVAVYRSALRLVDERYLWPERIEHQAMFRAAAERLEGRIDWLVVEERNGELFMGVGRATRPVRYTGDLADSLLALEDAVAGFERPLAEGLDVRAELLNGALSRLDRNSIVLAGQGLERFDERLTGTLSGIGVTLRTVDGQLTVAELFPGGPAGRGGLLLGDIFVRIDGVSTVGMTPADATTYIRGRAGTRVRLELTRDGKPLSIELERAEIPIPNVEGEEGPRGVGVVRIDHFSEQTVPNLRRVLEELHADGLLDVGLVIDLRGNSGGSLSQSARAADVFVDSGRIVTTVGRGGEKVAGLLRHVDARPDIGTALPAVVVLIDHETASGAEILAGALMQLDRAAILGETSFGKGTVQTLHELADGLKLKLTVAEYRVGNDVRVHEVGLKPDLALYPVRATEGRFWYPDAARTRARIGPDAPLLYYPQSRVDEGERDEMLELAASLLTVGVAADRESLVKAQSTLLASFAAIESSRVADALVSQDLDWTAGAPDGAVSVVATLPPAGPLRAGVYGEVSLTATNQGGTLHRAAVRLRSANPGLDDVVVPIGHFPAGETRTVRASVRPAADSASRTDRVVGVLECDGCEPVALFDSSLSVEGGATPRVSVAASYRDDAVHLKVTNTGEVSLGSVRVRLPFPEARGIELLEASTASVTLAPGESAELRQGLRVTEGFEGTELELEVNASADGWPALTRWDLALPRDGAVVHLEAPVVSVRPVRQRQARGQTVLHLTASDLDGLDHVMVSAGVERVNRTRWDAAVEWDDQKVFWRGNVDRRVNAAVPVPVGEGTNRYVIVAVDKNGLRTRREVYVFGEGEPPTDDGVALQSER